MKTVLYHKIRQFKDVVQNVRHLADYKGQDENGPIYETSEKPIITFTGTVKLHGTNAWVSYNPTEGLIAGKRSGPIPQEALSAHMGFNQFIRVEYKEIIYDYIKSLFEELKLTEDEKLIIYGEWAGTGIQKGVGISELPKAFYLFDLLIYNQKEDSYVWNPIELNINKEKLKSINQFTTYSIQIDFNEPGMTQNTLIEATTSVEEECPVAKQLGVSGVGEGIVWQSQYKGQKLIFKVKGEKHSSSKVKTLANVNEEELKSILDFVDYACTQNRVSQAIQETGSTTKQHTPEILRWVANDIISEETTTLVSNGLEWKQVAKEVSNKARVLFFAELDKV